jgi:ADP-heptose:LPS heptosyltransferase
LVVLAPSWAESLLRLAGCQDELLICDPPWWVSKRKARFGSANTKGSWFALWQTIWKIRSYNFDLCIEMRGDVRQIVGFGVLGGAKLLLTRQRNGGAVLADFAPKIDEQLHECEQNLLLIRALGVSETKPIFATPYSPEDVLHVQGLLADILKEPNVLTILIHPGAKWVNRWPIEYYSQVVMALGKDYPQLRVLLTGADSEAVLCQQIAASLPDRAFSLAGRLTLTESAALMALANLVIMADTGPMHFLNAISTPAVLLFGPTPPARFCPRGKHIEVIYTNDCCNTILHESCLRVTSGAPSYCMAKIPVQEVLCRVRRVLEPGALLSTSIKEV